MTKKKRILLVVIGVIALIFLFGTLALNLLENRLEKIVAREIETLNLNEIEDGQYIGKAGSFPVTVTVEVTIDSHMITDIEILKHNNGQGKSAEAIVEKVLTKQQLNVDTISGATYSSKVILLAIEDALKP